jgi:hypothetical protein
MATRKRNLSPLYSRYLTPDEKISLRVVPVDDFSSEINLLRVLNARLLELQVSAPQSLDSRILTIRTQVIIVEQLTRLVRSHAKENDPLDELWDEILQAINSLNFYEEVEP